VFSSQLRQAIEAAPRDRLPEIAKTLWAAYTAGGITDTDAEALSTLIDARKGSHVPGIAPPTLRVRVGSRPRTDASMERRRRWAATGRLPPQIACQFTQAEQAVLAVVTVEAVKRGDCRMHLDHIAAVAGVSRSTVRAALRRARGLGLLTIEERRASAWRNLSNVVRIVSREWQAWMRLARAPGAPGGGGISSPTTNTKAPGEDRQRPNLRLQEAFGMANGRPVRESATC
jgi:hypothetical protein